MTEDFYDLLEIPPDASQDDVKDAYREKVRVYHPDVNDDDRARAQFTAVKKAYDILGDPVERQAYDRLGHEEYVAKRTSGLPSPDVWRSDDRTPEATSSSTDPDETGPDESGTDERRSGKTFTYESSAAADSESRSTRSKAAAGAASTGTASTTAGTATGSSTTGTAGGTAAGAAGGGTTATADAAGTAAGGRSSDGTTSRTTRSAGATGSRSTSRGGDNPFARWWRRQNFSLPLLWLSILVYVAGLAHFARENAEALEGLATDLAAVGADPEGLQTVLSSGRHGVETPVAYVTGFELVAPPIAPLQWYAGLAGAVGLTLAGIVVARLVREGDLRRPITIDETIVVALALSVTTTLAGGPLLAGAVLMPVLFGVIVRDTRRGPGWKPSYLYVLPVLAPAGGFAAGVSGHASLAADLALFAVVPVAGALCLPVRAIVRKRYGV